MSSQLYEAEVLPGLGVLAEDELRRLLPEASLYDMPEQHILPFTYAGPLSSLTGFRTVVAVYRVLTFEIPRPKALLGHQHFSRLVDEIRDLQSVDVFNTFRFSAAGKDSRVFERLRNELARHTGMKSAPEDADMVIRVRPSIIQGSGWQVLLRLTPRPLATRDWRICDMEGALNATIAAAMVEITAPSTSDRVLNAMCGSGTLLIERALRLEAQSLVGVDNNADALSCGWRNATAAKVDGLITFQKGDIRNIRSGNGAFDVILADLPWGNLVGSVEDNKVLYPEALQEMARVAQQGARVVLITHAITLMRKVLHEQSDLWRAVQELKVFQGGLHPRIFILKRK